MVPTHHSILGFGFQIQLHNSKTCRIKQYESEFHRMVTLSRAPLLEISRQIDLNMIKLSKQVQTCPQLSCSNTHHSPCWRYPWQICPSLSMRGVQPWCLCGKGRVWVHRPSTYISACWREIGCTSTISKTSCWSSILMTTTFHPTSLNFIRHTRPRITGGYCFWMQNYCLGACKRQDTPDITLQDIAIFSVSKITFKFIFIYLFFLRKSKMKDASICATMHQLLRWLTCRTTCMDNCMKASP